LILHCNRNMDEMREVAEAAPILSGKALERTERALGALRRPKPLALAEVQARLDAALAQAV
jgi:beta-N-acetylhexosaminidase